MFVGGHGVGVTAALLGSDSGLVSVGDGVLVLVLEGGLEKDG